MSATVPHFVSIQIQMYGDCFFPCGDSIMYVTDRFKNSQASTWNAVDSCCCILQAFWV